MIDAVLFTASWCRPCKELKQWMFNKGISLPHANIDEAPETAKQVGVKKVPTLRLASGELLVGREEIKPYLEKHHDSAVSNS